MTTTVAVDGGGAFVKFYDGLRVHRFPAAISYSWRDRNLDSPPPPYGYDWEYGGQKGFAGTLAQEETDWADSLKGDTKAHPEARLRILIALHQWSATESNLIVGQPIDTHTVAQKQLIKDLLVGRHELKVNGERKIILIRKCEVAAEGVSAGLLIPGGGTKRIIDIGSGTINCGTIIDRRLNDRGSFTLLGGLETLKTTEPVSMAAQIWNACHNRKWQRNDEVYTCGGGAEDLTPALQAHFPRIVMMDDPVTANVRAFHLLARRFYG